MLGPETLQSAPVPAWLVFTLVAVSLLALGLVGLVVWRELRLVACAQVITTYAVENQRLNGVVKALQAKLRQMHLEVGWADNQAVTRSLTPSLTGAKIHTQPTVALEWLIRDGELKPGEE